MQAIYVHVTQLHYFLRGQPVPVFLALDMVTDIHAFKRMTFISQSAIHGKTINPFQVADVQGNGIAPQLLVLQPGMVVAYQQGIEILERHFVLAQIGDELPEIHFQLVRSVVTPLVLQFLNAGVGIGDETKIFQPLSGSPLWGEGNGCRLHILLSVVIHFLLQFLPVD